MLYCTHLTFYQAVKAATAGKKIPALMLSTHVSVSVFYPALAYALQRMQNLCEALRKGLGQLAEL